MQLSANTPIISNNNYFECRLKYRIVIGVYAKENQSLNKSNISIVCIHSPNLNNKCIGILIMCVSNTVLFLSLQVVVLSYK